MHAWRACIVQAWGSCVEGVVHGPDDVACLTCLCDMGGASVAQAELAGGGGGCEKVVGSGIGAQAASKASASSCAAGPGSVKSLRAAEEWGVATGGSGATQNTCIASPVLCSLPALAALLSDPKNGRTRRGIRPNECWGGVAWSRERG